MVKILFVILMATIALIDKRTFTIHNLVVIPSCLIGCLLTEYWLSALFMFVLGSFIYSRNKLGGGDVKLMAMLGAFLGYKALFVFAISFLLSKSYRKIKKYKFSLAFAPFVYFTSLLFLW